MMNPGNGEPRRRSKQLPALALLVRALHVLALPVRALPARLLLARALLSRALLARALLPVSLCLSLGAPFSASGQVQQQSVRAQLGASSISIEESVRLAIVATNIDGELDASALDADFNVTGRSSSRSVETINGIQESTVTWVLELEPRASGIFTIPSVTVDGIPSDLLTLTVTDAPSGSARDVFVEAELDNTRPWVQSQVILTQRVFSGIDIVEGSLGPPKGEGLEVRQIGEDRQYAAERDGREYRVTERRYALFPQRSGVLTVEPMVLSVLVPAEPSRVRGFFSPTRRMERRSPALSLDVQARPDGSSGWWLPASRVELSERQATADGSGASAIVAPEVRIGEPLTRTIVLSASGVLENQLPAIDAPDVPGLSIYADEPARLSQVTPDGVDASQNLSFAIIPERAGEFELPPVQVSWFDVTSGQERTAELPARRLTVLPAVADTAAEEATGLAGSDGMGAAGDTTLAGLDSSSGSAPSTRRQDAERALLPPDNAEGGATSGVARPPTADALPAGVAEAIRRQADAVARSRSLWRVVAALALFGWAATALAWFLVRRKSARTQLQRGGTIFESTRLQRAAERRVARRALQDAVREGSASATAKAVLARAALRWPAASPKSLGSLTQRLDPDATTLKARLTALDAALYSAANASAYDESPGFEDLPDLLEQALGTTDPGEHGRDAQGPGRAEASMAGHLPQL